MLGCSESAQGCTGCGYGLAAVRTATRVDWNLAQAFRALLCGGIGRGRRFAHARDQGVDGRHHKKVDRRGDQQKRDGRVDEVSDRKQGAARCCEQWKRHNARPPLGHDKWAQLSDHRRWKIELQWAGREQADGQVCRRRRRSRTLCWERSWAEARELPSELW